MAKANGGTTDAQLKARAAKLFAAGGTLQSVKTELGITGYALYKLGARPRKPMSAEARAAISAGMAKSKGKKPTAPAKQHIRTAKPVSAKTRTRRAQASKTRRTKTATTAKKAVKVA